MMIFQHLKTVIALLLTKSFFALTKSNINVVYAADRASLPYTMLSTFTLSRSLSRTTQVNFYVIIVDSSKSVAKKLVAKAKSAFNCLSYWRNIEFIPFSYPSYSPLILNDRVAVGNPHWYSDQETVRSQIPILMPNLNRFIYFDNDIIVTKKGVIETLWQQSLNGSAVGLVFDDLQMTESKKYLKSYFNDSSDLLMKYFSEQFEYVNSYNELIRAFNKLFPRFPNNGVMLVDAERWRALNLSGQFLSLAQDCKHAEERGEEHVAWGSQPASIVILRKHWSELPQVCMTDVRFCSKF